MKNLKSNRFVTFCTIGGIGGHSTWVDLLAHKANLYFYPSVYITSVLIFGSLCVVKIVEDDMT